MEILSWVCLVPGSSYYLIKSTLRKQKYLKLWQCSNSVIMLQICSSAVFKKRPKLYKSIHIFPHEEMKFVSSNFLPLDSKKTGDIHKIVLSFHCLRPGIFLRPELGYRRKGKMENNCIIQVCLADLLSILFPYTLKANIDYITSPS